MCMHARVDSYFSLPLSIHLSIASSSFSFPRVRIFHLLPSLSLIFIAESFAATLTSNIGGGVFIALKGDAADVDDGVGHVFALLAVLDDVIVTGAVFSSPTGDSGNSSMQWPHTYTQFGFILHLYTSSSSILFM